MSRSLAQERGPWAIPSTAEAAWHELQNALAAAGTVPCRAGEAAHWWPDRRDLGSPTTYGAIQACSRCPASSECLAYAMAADERFGIWGGTTPDDRRALRWARAGPG